MFGLTQKKGKKSGMAEITVRHPLASIIKIATKSSCPEMLSFTYGDKIDPGKSNTEAAASIVEEKTNENSLNNSTNNNAEYNVKGKDWFFIPDYAGEAASAVKLQILQVIDLV